MTLRTRLGPSALAWPLTAVLLALALSCRSPTEITVVVTTDFACGDLRNVAVTVGTLGSALETSPSTTLSTTCTGGYVGTLVVVPSGADDALVAVKVVGGFGVQAESCVAAFDASAQSPSYGSGCIVARRAIHYTPHTPLTVPIVLRAACAGVPCGETTTCVSGACVPATIPDPSLCAGAGSGCPETVLVGDGGSPADATVAADTGPGVESGADVGADVGEGAESGPDAGADASTTGCPTAKGSVMIRFDTPSAGSFCIDQHEATNRDFNAYLNDANATFDAPAVCRDEANGVVPRPTPASGQDALPVANVTFCDAWSYCKWAGKRLCSTMGGPDAGHANDQDDLSNEWDYACRNGAAATQFPYGNTYEGGICNVLDPDAGVNSVLVAPETYAACHGIAPGFDQIFDMSGNIAEMDDWATSYADQPDANASTGTHTRGGSFDYGFLRACTDRFPHQIFETFSDVGFRCCADAP